MLLGLYRHDCRANCAIQTWDHDLSITSPITIGDVIDRMSGIGMIVIDQSIFKVLTAIQQTPKKIDC